MKLRFDDSVEAFRAELLDWLAANRPTPEEMAADPSVSTGHAPAWARRWTRTMFDAGWLVPGWPPERGGRNAGPIETLVYIEELAKAACPRTTNVQGLGIVAPSILDYGTEAQIRDYAMPILRGERHGVPRHERARRRQRPRVAVAPGRARRRPLRDQRPEGVDLGRQLRRLLLPVLPHRPRRAQAQGHQRSCSSTWTRPGITVRPLPEIIHPEHPDLNEVFLSDVVVPAENLVGELNNGWAMANGSLAHERGMVWVSAVMGLEEAMEKLLHDAPRLTERMTDAERAVAVDQIVRLAIDTAAARCLGYRGFAKLARGGSAPEQALMKVFASEARQRVALVAAEIQGADAVEVGTVDMDGHQSIDEPQGTWLEQYFHSFANTISAGASEIQRNIIAERVLGLPRS